MTPYHAVFSPSPGASAVRVAFSGGPGNIADAALFRESFSGVAEVPTFGAFRNGCLALPWDFDGEAVLTYAAFPEPVGDATPRTAVLSVDDASAQAVVFFVAAGLVMEENPTLGRRFQSLYRELLSDAEPARAVRGITPALYAASAPKLRQST